MPNANSKTVLFYGVLVQVHTLVRAAKAHARIAGGLEILLDIRRGNRVTTGLRVGFDCLPLELVQVIEHQLRWIAFNEVEAEFVKMWLESADPESASTNKGCDCPCSEKTCFAGKEDSELTYSMILENCFFECGSRQYLEVFFATCFDGEDEDVANFVAFYALQLVSTAYECDYHFNDRENDFNHLKSYYPVGVVAPVYSGYTTGLMGIDFPSPQAWVGKSCVLPRLPDGVQPWFYDWNQLCKTYELTTGPRVSHYDFSSFPEATLDDSSSSATIKSKFSTSTTMPKSYESGGAVNPCWRVWLEATYECE